MPNFEPGLWTKKFCSWRRDAYWGEYLRREPEPRGLQGPSGRRVSQICDADATRQASIDRGLHQTRCQEGERYRHIDLADGAVFSGSDLFYVRDHSRDQLIEPMPSLRDRGDEFGAGFGADWTRVGEGGCRCRGNNLPRSF